MLQLLRRVVKKESSSSMTVRKRRIFGMKKKLTMQHKSNPDRGIAHRWYAWGNIFSCFVYWIHILYLFFSGLGCLFLQIIHLRVPWGMGVEAAGRPLRKRMLRKRPVLSSLQQLKLRVSATTYPQLWIFQLNLFDEHSLYLWCAQTQGGQWVLVRLRWAPLVPGVAPLSRAMRVHRTQAGPPSPNSSLLAGKATKVHFNATYDTVLECF